MGRKILVVGGVAGGASAAARLRRLSEDDAIVMFERGEHVSFSNCSLPYYLSGVVEEADDLVLMEPEDFKNNYNIDARVGHEVLSINRENKTVRVRRLADGSVYDEGYDKLVLSPGAKPIVESVKGLSDAELYVVRNVTDIARLKKAVSMRGKTDVAVVGGGFIGMETAENLRLAGHGVSVIAASGQVLNTYDEDMAQIFHKELLDHGVALFVGEKLDRYENGTLFLRSGKALPAEVVVMAKGVAPETALAAEAGLALGETGAVAVDRHGRTSDPDIYAVGDAVEVANAQTGRKMKLSLAGPALRQARGAADHIHGRTTPSRGYIGTSAIKVFDLNAAATGLNEAAIRSLGLKLDYGVARVILSDKVSLMPDASPLHLKLLFEKPSGRLLGAQAIGRGDASKRIDVIATAVRFGGTVEDLQGLELAYAPPYGTAKDVVNYAGYVGANLLNGDFKQVNVDRVRSLVEEGALIVDVRGRGEFESGHIKGALNIPLGEIRARAAEIPRDRPVYLHCRSGQRSYNAVRILQNLGYTEVYNVAGSFLGLSYYEYFRDQTTGRIPIVTEYNFI